MTKKEADESTVSAASSGYVFRVYSSFHEFDESGTYEYGYYSTHEKALARLIYVWNKAGYPQPKEKNKTETGWYVRTTWDGISIDIQRCAIDEDIDDDLIGYT